MASVEISPGKPGTLIVRFEYARAIVAAIKQLPGHRWNPDGKFLTVADTPENRARLAALAAHPMKASIEYLAVTPKRSASDPSKPRRPSVPGKPLTTKRPLPLLKQVDDELILRGMAYGTRKSYGQHLRSYVDWLKVKPEEATREDVRAYLVQMAMSGRFSAGYCRGARAALIFLYETILNQLGKVCDLPRMKRPEQLPVVLSREEVAKLLKVTSNLKHNVSHLTALPFGFAQGML